MADDYIRKIRYPDGFMAAATTAEFLEGCHDVLVVGDSGGRDATYLKHLGKEVTQLDVAQQDIENLIVQSIEDRTPFGDGAFDGVVLNEVLEHLYRDVDALREIRRVLRSSGTLVVSVPASRRQDRAEFHVRIHTRRTLERLLGAGGFKVEELFSRGMCCRLTAPLPVRATFLLLQSLLGCLPGFDSERAARVLNTPLLRFERFMGRHRFWDLWQSLFISYGFWVKARPDAITDPLDVQIESFAWSRT